MLSDIIKCNDHISTVATAKLNGTNPQSNPQQNFDLR